MLLMLVSIPNSADPMVVWFFSFSIVSTYVECYHPRSDNALLQ